MKNTPAPKWQYDELEHSGIDYADPKVAEKYDERHTKFRDYEKGAQLIMERLKLGSEHTVVDLGCGTGAFALTAARSCKKIHAVDVSPAMLDQLGRKAERLGLKNIATHQAGFLTYVHEGDPVEAVVSVAALHHLPDFWKAVAFKRMHEMLGARGKLYLFDVIFSFDIDKYTPELNEWIDIMERNGAHEMAKETVVHIRDEFSTFDWVIEGMLERTGFSIEQKHADFPRCLTYVCRKG